jgi:hypothetical protein
VVVVTAEAEKGGWPDSTTMWLSTVFIVLSLYCGYHLASTIVIPRMVSDERRRRRQHRRRRQEHGVVQNDDGDDDDDDDDDDVLKDDDNDSGMMTASLMTKCQEINTRLKQEFCQ